ncbi:MAG: hypothetical protein V2A74_12940 [bacterium]
MDLKFFYISLRWTVVIALLVTVIALGYGHYSWAGRYAAIAGWTIVNLLVISELLLAAFRDHRRDKALVFLALKLIMLALLVAFAYYVGLEITSFLAGFNTFFFVIILKALGRMLVESQHRASLPAQK